MEGCCGTLSETDREGITTEYGYDSLKRLDFTKRAGITTRYQYDSEGRTIKTIREGSDASQIIINESHYDVAGRLVSSKDALGFETRYSEDFDQDGHRVRKTTYPDGSSRIETYYKDGSLLSLTGTAVHPLKY